MPATALESNSGISWNHPDSESTLSGGVLVRLSDKYSRIKSLSTRERNEGEFVDESIEDTLIDLANYALIAIILLKERKAALNIIGKPEHPKVFKPSEVDEWVVDDAKEWIDIKED